MPFYLFLSSCIVSFVFLAGCQSYTPPPELGAVTNRTPDRFDLKSYDDARIAARTLNPEINRLRLESMYRDKIAEASGWWEDPAVSGDLLRILNGGPNPWIYGGSLDLTIPVTGIPALRKKAARFYSEAQRYKVADAEYRLDVRVVTACDAVFLADRTWQLQQRLVRKLGELFRSSEQLFAAGEITGESFTSVQQTLAEAKRQFEQDAQTRAEAYRELLVTMGFAPDARMGMFSTEITLDKTPPQIQPDKLFRHPAVQARLKLYKESEASLRAELRRQYPELKLGPALGYEEGDIRSGLSIGTTLPLWNRNRLGIAEARLRHALAYDDTRTLYRELVNDSIALSARYRQQVEAFETARKNQSRAERQIETARQMFAAGEAGPGVLAVAEAYLGECDRSLSAACIAAHQTLIQLNYLDKEIE